MKNICIIGSGSWGVALGIHLAKLGNKVDEILLNNKWYQGISQWF